MLGWEVRFRAGFLTMVNRNLDPITLEPLLDKWNGYPKNYEDHTWLEFTLIPSLRSFVCDPSWHQLDLDMDLGYSRFGRRLPLNKLQCSLVIVFVCCVFIHIVPSMCVRV